MLEPVARADPPDRGPGPRQAESLAEVPAAPRLPELNPAGLAPGRRAREGWTGFDLSALRRHRLRRSGPRRTASTGAVRCACARKRSGRAAAPRARGIPRRYEHCTLESFEIHERQPRDCPPGGRGLGRALARRSTHGLLFLGPPGTGKTHLAVAIARELIARRKGARVLFREQRELLKAHPGDVRPGHRPQRDRRLGPGPRFRGPGPRRPGRRPDHGLGAGRPPRPPRAAIQRPRADDPDLQPRGPEDAEGRAALATAVDALTLRDRLGDALMSRIYEMCRIVDRGRTGLPRGVLHARFHY